MMIRRWPFLVLAAAGCWAAACGGSSQSGLTSGGDAGGAGGDAADGGGRGSGGSSAATGGQGGSATGGASGSGGAAGGTGGAAGAATGGTAGAGAGGAAGADAGGADAGSAGCAPPAAPTDTAICLTLDPEPMDFESDPTLDGKGALVVEIFDQPDPPDSATPLFSTLVPSDAESGGTIALDALPVVRVDQTLPDVVYVRVIFADNPAVFGSSNDLTYGTWLGGFDLSQRLENVTLDPIAVDAGKGNALTIALTAFRRLDVTVTTSATPIGDGEGPLSAIAVRDPTPSNEPHAEGLASLDCADLSGGGPVDLTGFVIGSGRFWVGALLKDLGGKDLPPGSLSSLEVADGGLRIAPVLDVAERDYSPSVTVDLGFVVPLDADGGAPGPNSCADLGGP